MRLPLALTALLCASTLHAQIPTTLDISLRAISGEAVDDSVRVFRGLPYAQPPTGPNRWRAPQALEAWSGVRDATTFAQRCMQQSGDPGSMSEDCLYLNVWSAAPDQEALRPVIVWIHGGGFTGGTGSDVRYDGAGLARQGAVVVTMNYRLGPFGFLAHPALSAEGGERRSGNYAMLDMIAVLEWVYDNIASFGGDPINVTIVGESAGAHAVATLLASPRAAGLFHRAVAQRDGWVYEPPNCPHCQNVKRRVNVKQKPRTPRRSKRYEPCQRKTSLRRLLAAASSLMGTC
jgi:para-nitrobenzyl esterase